MDGMFINTVQFRFPAGSPNPTWEEIARFLKELDTDLLTMESSYKTAQDRSLYIKFVSSDAMKESLQKNMEQRKFVYNSGKLVNVRMSIAGANMQYVRVFDLPPELGDDQLSLVLGEYGKIDRVIREKFPADLGLDHLHNGIRGVYMEVKRSIPPAIDVAGLRGRVFYDGLKDTCFWCYAEGHRKDSCPQRQAKRSKKKVQQEKPGERSYANIVAGKPIAPAMQIPSDLIEDDIIEVIEEEIDDQDTNETEPEQEQPGPK